ncbi:hypothetical protein QBC35DRAFT_109438 [Podospora australis]|uniref:Dihydroneopterin aldolase/epimerase domain-containing protein n=1 Tax=Podospora australis TaxID=1536484 RepID=A0AAN7AQ42_9PEZI|nr:hypothetical protein QBC35DRAFT_109438 [Podospora australis]
MSEEIPLKTTFAVRSLAGEPPASVSVKNLQCLLQHGGRDAWHRSSKTQPCLISAEVGFSQPFDLASESDKLGEDTVHYGSLSKHLLSSIETYTPQGAKGGGGEEEQDVQDVLGRLWEDLTGVQLDGTEPEGEGKKKGGFLGESLKRVGLLSVKILLPKASLLGEGVSYTATAAFDKEGRMTARALQMGVLRVRVPVLIGVNKNEREARQMLITSVGIEMVGVKGDRYTRVEGVLVKALQESAFETLEALGAHLIDRIEEGYVNARDYHVHVEMEKPIAVPLADCPIVEVRRLVKDYYR